MVDDPFSQSARSLGEGLRAMYADFMRLFTPDNTEMITIEKGDTLWAIAEKHLGSGTRWQEIYVMNMDVIHAAQVDRRVAIGSDMIFPGTQIRVMKKL